MFEMIEKIVSDSNALLGGNKLIVKGFGRNKDLELHIEKDEEFDPTKDKDWSNLVDIVTMKDGEAVNDTIGIYVTDGCLYDELIRLYNYESLETL